MEQRVRKYALEYGDLYVVTGPVLKAGLKTIGSEEVSVPESFYKIIYQPNLNGGSLVSYLIPVEARSSDLNDFLVSVDEVEALTGVDFFSQLDDSVEVRLEKVISNGF